jgi:hypothetical protein
LCGAIVRRAARSNARDFFRARLRYKYINTSYLERANLTMRMHMRRFTRLTNAFSKKFENHCRMVALYAVWYNFIRIHKTLRVTPAMESSIVDHLFSFEDMVGIVDEWEASQKQGETNAND